MANDENLTPYQPGQSGNPSGKPPGTKNRATIIKEILALKTGDKTNEYIINDVLFKKAADGDLGAIKEIQDTVYGKIVDKSENTQTITMMGTIKVPSPDGERPFTFDIGGAKDA